MTELRFAVIDVPDTSVCLDQFGEIADVPHETKRKFFYAPDAPIPLNLELFIEIVQLERRFFKITEFHVDCTCLKTICGMQPGCRCWARPLIPLRAGIVASN
jgi:hypothetical protein